MHYDIAIKRLMELGGREILHQLAGLELAQLDSLDETSQESLAVKRCDFAGRYQATDGSEGIAIVEFQTRWETLKPLDMAIYSAMQRRKHLLPVLPILVLFKPDPRATDLYTNECLTFRYRLVRMWESHSHDWLQSAHPSLWPLAGLATDAVACADEVDTKLHNSELPRVEKSDLITIFTLFLGLQDVEIASKLSRKRRELMIESPLYALIKTEGRVEGRVEGMLEGRKRSLLDILDERFHPLPENLVSRIEQISSQDQLARLIHTALRSQTLQEVEAALS